MSLLPMPFKMNISAKFDFSCRGDQGEIITIKRNERLSITSLTCVTANGVYLRAAYDGHDFPVLLTTLTVNTTFDDNWDIVPAEVIEAIQSGIGDFNA